MDVLNKLFKNEEEIELAISWCIYLLDLGKFIANCDVVIANMDENLDPGVIVEIMMAH
jgi:nucleoside 2-deoxyribosyltransferase